MNLYLKNFKSKYKGILIWVRKTLLNIILMEK
jgi:hypothetical protein